MSILKRSGSEKGFTMLEILIALAISAIVMAGVMSVFQTFMKHTTGQNLLVEAQQNARAGISFIQKDLVQLGHRMSFNIYSTLILADANEIEFRFVDPMAATGEENIKVRYAVNGDDALTRRRCEQGQNWDTCTELNRVVIENLDSSTALEFEYYDALGQALTPTPLSMTLRNNVRFIKVSLTTVTSAKLQNLNPPDTRTFEVHTETRLRNVEISTAPSDIDAPAQPTSLRVREYKPGSRGGVCGRLSLRWAMGIETDMRGYRVFYTVGETQKNVTVPLSALTDDGTYYYYTLAPMDGSNYLLTSTMSTDAAVTYSIGVRAFDSSNNSSILSGEVTGDPDPSEYDLSSGSNDTTINPTKPEAVDDLIAADGGEGEVALTWSYDLADNPDVIGFRVYRNTTSFTLFPLAEAGDLKWIAGATSEGRTSTIGPNDTTFTDSDSALIGCQQYYYAIAPVNCDASLISDDLLPDDETVRYVEADYGFTYGDGDTDDTQTGGADGGADEPDGSDTSPNDETIPLSPAVEVNAGWMRVAVTLTQPTSDDLLQSCVYTNEGGAYPALETDTDTYPISDYSGCYKVDDTVTFAAQLVPDSGGTFTVSELAGGLKASFWHDSMTVESPASPSLLDGGTYSYRSVAFDRCGNASAVAGAQATTILCGEDPPLCSDPPVAEDPSNCVQEANSKPPAVTNADADCCGTADGVTLTWTHVPSDASVTSTENNPWDLAGYRIFRATADDAAGWLAATLINPDTPYYGESWPDGGTDDGSTYYYRIVSVDCPYERGNPDEDTIRGHMNDDTLNYAQVGPVQPGEILRDEQCSGAGACTADGHREIFTGVSLLSTNATSPLSSYEHNTVTLFLENTSAGTQTIEKMTVKWINDLAYLRKITIGGGRSGVTVTSTDIAESQSQTLTPDPPTNPYAKQISEYDITDAQIDAKARYVPVILEFKDTNNDPIDMRGIDLSEGEKVYILLDIKNDSTEETGCTSYLTTDETDSNSAIPLGPEITSVRQNIPDSTAYAVPGPDPSDPNTVPSGDYGSLVATGGSNITIAVITEGKTTHGVTGSKVGVSSATLYWAETTQSDTDATDGSPSAATFEGNAVTMTNAGGNNWEGTIMATDVSTPPLRIWYYLVTIDDDGNYDRSPPIDEGYYTYDQKPFDACDFTPSATSVSLVSESDTYVRIEWPTVTTYTDDELVNSSDPLVYQVWRRDEVDESYSKLYEVPGTTPASCIVTIQGDVDGSGPGTAAHHRYCDTDDAYRWQDTFANVSSGTPDYDFTYYVVAENSCSADDNASSQSNTYRECIGATSASISISPDPAVITSEETYTVTVNDCTLSGNGTLDTVTINNVSANETEAITVTETGASTGLFTKVIDTVTGSSSASDEIINVGPTDSSDDGIDVSCSSGCTGSPASQTVRVSAAPCDFNPATPVNFVESGSTGNTFRAQWDRNSEPDMKEYNVYRSSNGTDFSVLEQVTHDASDPVTYANNHGPGSYWYYIKAVDTCSDTADNESSATATIAD